MASFYLTEQNYQYIELESNYEYTVVSRVTWLKSKRLLADKLKLINIAVIVVDARAPSQYV